MNRLKQFRRFLFSRSKNKQRVLVLAFGLLGFLLPMFYGYIVGFPVAYIHDEMSYTLAGDTFAHGRLTNPSPESWENFEAPHILARPSYMSKYPPMQGLFLASGQVVFGQQAFGIWISCGLAAAAFFWMMSAWTRPKWAMLGTILMIVLLGIHGYWAQSYWGGMAAASGGALFFGGFRRLFKNLTVGSTVLMTIGGIMLVNSRPFEGTVAMVPSLFVLLVWILRDGRYTFLQKFSRILLPGLLLTSVALSAMAYYNYRVTGNALRFAYTEHQSQYFETPLFIFQAPAKSELRGSPRLKKLYKSLNCSWLIRDLDEFSLPNKVYLYPVYGFTYLFLYLPYFFIGPLLTVLLFVTAPLLFRNKWMRLMMATVVFTLACMSFAAYWDFSHYAAPITCCFFLLVVEGMRYFVVSKQNRPHLKLTILLLALISVASISYKWYDDTTQYLIPEQVSGIDLNADRPVKLKIPIKLSASRPVFEEAAQKTPQNYLIFVAYDEEYDLHDELVYNHADYEASKVIWAADLGAEQNRALRARYPDRKVLRISLKGEFAEVAPFPADDSAR